MYSQLQNVILVLEIVYPDDVDSDQIDNAIKYALSDYRYVFSTKWHSISNLNPLTDALIITRLDYEALTNWSYLRFEAPKILELGIKNDTTVDPIIKTKSIWAGKIYVVIRYSSMEMGMESEANQAKSLATFKRKYPNFDPSKIDTVENKMNILSHSILCEIKDSKLVATNMAFDKSTADAVEYYKSTFKMIRTRFNEFFANEFETSTSISIDDLNSD